MDEKIKCKYCKKIHENPPRGKLLFNITELATISLDELKTISESMEKLEWLNLKELVITEKKRLKLLKNNT